MRDVRKSRVQVEAESAARDSNPVCHHNPQHLRAGERRKRKINASQSQGRKPDEETEKGCRRAAGENAQPGRQSGVIGEQRRSIGTHAEECGMTEAYLTGKPEEQVPARRQDGKYH